MILSLLSSDPIIFFALIFAMLLSLSLHEFSHAWTADYLGDETPGQAGRLTINPLAHIDPFGFLLFMLVGFGWGKPVPFDPYQLRNARYGSALVGIAGPAANLLLAVIFGVVLKALISVGTFDLTNGVDSVHPVIQFFAYVVIINVLWMLFNLLPIPPLDGSKVLFALLPDSFEELKIQLTRVGPFLLLFLLILDRFLGFSFFDKLFSGVISSVTSWIFG